MGADIKPITLSFRDGTLTRNLAMQVLKDTNDGRAVPTAAVIDQVVRNALGSIAPELLTPYFDAARREMPEGPCEISFAWRDAPSGWHRLVAGLLAGAISHRFRDDRVLQQLMAAKGLGVPVTDTEALIAAAGGSAAAIEIGFP